MSNPMPDPIPASGNDELRDADKLDFQSWFQRAWWEAYHAGGVDAMRFTGSRRLLDRALPEFKILLAASNQQAVQKALENPRSKPWTMCQCGHHCCGHNNLEPFKCFINGCDCIALTAKKESD